MLALKNIALLALAGSAAAKTLVKQLGVHRWVDNEPGSASTNAALAITYQPYNLSVPVDHFKNSSVYEPHTDEFFNLRYYFDASHYKPGGPVIVLCGGETGVDDRLPYLQQGIVYELSKATNGVGVILEHRYYGTSFPPANIAPDLSDKSLRFLTTEQALEDTVYFAKHIKFPGLENTDLTAPGTAWYAYGGSYAGAFVAFLRTLYPGTFHGAISASGVTEAITDYWQYYQPIINHGPPLCMKYLTNLTSAVDHIFFHNGSYNQTLKEAFGLGQLKDNQDFTEVLSGPVGYWQSRNWDPAVDDSTFLEWCAALTSPVPNPATVNQTDTARKLLAAGGYGKTEISNLTTALVNWFGYVKENAVASCTGDQNACFQVNNPEYYAQDDISTWSWRSWAWQYCNQWGFFQTGSGTPANVPSLVSRLQDIPYNAAICQMAFNITKLPDTQAINQWGGFNISYPRLAITGGHADPWRDATPLAESLPPRKCTDDEPVFLIDIPEELGGVHHWDENGVFANVTNATFPPKQIQEVHKVEADAVIRWLAEFKSQSHAEM